MQYTALRRKVKIAVHFGAPAMGMRRESVPYASFVEFGKSHYQLTTLNSLEVYVLVNRTTICIRRRTQFYTIGCIEPGMNCREIGVRRVGHQIEGSWSFRAFAGEAHFPTAPADVQTLQRRKPERLSIHDNGTCRREIQNAYFTAFAKITACSFTPRPKMERRIRGHDSADYGAIDIRVNKLKAAGEKKILYQKLPP
jgi:hypothetical protein